MFTTEYFLHAPVGLRLFRERQQRLDLRRKQNQLEMRRLFDVSRKLKQLRLLDGLQRTGFLMYVHSVSRGCKCTVSATFNRLERDGWSRRCQWW